MSRRLIIRPEAESELLTAFDWYEEQSPGLGSELLQELDKLFSRIIETPLQFQKVYRETRMALTRRFPYEVFFVDDGTRVVVVSVFQANRNPQSWKDRV